MTFFLAGFLTSLLIVLGAAYWYLGGEEKSVVITSGTDGLMPEPQARKVPFKVKILLPKQDRASIPPKGWFYGLKGELHVANRVYVVAGDVQPLPPGPPYEISALFEGSALVEALAQPGDVFDVRLVVSLCKSPDGGCEKTGEASLTSSTWVRLSRAQFMESKGIDFGTRMINYVVAASDPSVACPNGVLSGTVEASPTMQPLLAATKQVLVLVPPGVGVISGPQEIRVWMKELSFTGTKAAFSAMLDKDRGALAGTYQAAVAFCKKGVPDLECVKGSELWNSKLRSYPFGQRRYLQLVTKNFAALACGAPPATLLMHMLEPKDLNASFDALPASIPEEVRAAPWTASCPECASLTK